jgi:hypothetical protein
MAKCHQHGMVIDCLGIMCFYLVEMDDPSSKRNECARAVEGWMDGQPENKAQTHQAFLRHEWSVVCSFRLTLGSARLNRFPFFPPFPLAWQGYFWVRVMTRAMRLDLSPIISFCQTSLLLS